MSRPAIIVDGLGKKYKIGIDRRAAMHRTFREAMVAVASYPIRRLRALGEETTAANEFWALKDVSFEVQPGEVVGIIGRNGAGKSTLLKILSRITEPTKGRAEIRGRVGSLLEVGTGFHQELTGRENIYLNGAILGMRKADIRRKFDEIVAFSEVEKFLDTPVKRYSSGMYVRLAFAVAAHLNPEVLIIDEVLAVGDAGFQRKCLGKMGEASREGRTVLFVSHNMGAVRALTNSCILLDHGTLSARGGTEAVICQYLSRLESLHVDSFALAQRHSVMLGNKIRIDRIRPTAEFGSCFRLGEPLRFAVQLLPRITTDNLSFGLTILDTGGGSILSAMSTPCIHCIANEPITYLLEIRDHRLAPGSYAVALSVGEGGLTEARLSHDVVRPGPHFSIASVGANGHTAFQWSSDYGAIMLPSSLVDVTQMVAPGNALGHESRLIEGVHER